MPADRDGRLTGSDAVTFFQRSGLSRELLAKVWAQADYTRRGYLDLPAFAKAMDLISLAQAGLSLTQDSYRQAKASGIRPPRMAGLEVTMGSARGTGTSNPFMPQQVGEGGRGYLRLDPALMSIWVPGCLARYVILFFLHAPGRALSGVGAGGVPAGGRRGAAAADRPPAGSVCGGARVPLHEPAQPLRQRACLQEEKDGALLQGSRGHHRRPQANLFQQGAERGGVS